MSNRRAEKSSDSERRAFELVATLAIGVPGDADDVADELAAIGEDALPALEAALQEPNAVVRRVALTALRGVRSRRMLPALTEIVARDGAAVDEQTLALRAIESIATPGDSESLTDPVLTLVQEAPAPSTRCAAIDVLAAMDFRDVDCVDLHATFTRLGRKLERGCLLDAVTAAMRRGPDARAHPGDDDTSVRSERARLVRTWMLLHLLEPTGARTARLVARAAALPDTVSLVEELLAFDHPRAPQRAMEIAAATRDEQARQQLTTPVIRHLRSRRATSDSAVMGLRALPALSPSTLDSHRLRELVTRWSRDPDPCARAETARFAARCWVPEVTPHLRALLDDSNPIVSDAAITACLDEPCVGPTLRKRAAELLADSEPQGSTDPGPGALQ